MAGKIIKTRSKSKKLLKENENTVQCVKDVNLTSTERIRRKPLTIESDPHVQSARTNKTSISKNVVIKMKSPILRDRTNTTNELVKPDFSLKENTKVKSIEEKKSIKQRIVKDAEEKIDVKLLKNVEVLIQKYNLKKTLPSRQNIRKNSVNICQEKNLEKESAKENVDTIKLNNIEQNVHEIKELSNNNLESQNTNVIKNKVFKKKNISLEVLDQLLNHDEETDTDLASNNIVKTGNVKTKEVEKNIMPNIDEKELDILKSIENNKLLENRQITKKFFKNKVTEKELKTLNGNVKNEQQKVVRRKNIKSKQTKDSDNSFIFKTKEQRKSIKPLKKNLRTRTVKNYCEESKLNQSRNSFVEELPNIEKDCKGIPIYKTVQLSQENIKDKEEIYNFPDDSQEIKQKVKKRKKVVKKPITTKTKKNAFSKVTTFQKVQKQSTKKTVRTVHFNDQVKKQKDLKQTAILNNVKTNFIVPESLQKSGDTTMEEASTIKIVSDQILEQCKRIDLTVTPPVPKTIASELKLFGPKNVITSKPTAQYKKMVNHSLIRKSISPIKKLIENFDAGSPWRPIDPFSRVQNIVQSTPQVNKLPLIQEKKLSVQLKDLHKKPIIFDDSINNGKAIENNEKTMKIEIPPRKDEIMISNSTDTECTTEKNLNTNKNSPEITCSPVQIASPAVNSIEQSLVDQVLKDTSYAINNKENKTPNTRMSPKKKFSAPSPFRFEKIRSSRRIASIESRSKSSKCIVNKENEIEPKAGPSNIEKPESVVLRQSNLNNFLNLPEMPESTHIFTKHGIFDDAYSTPIRGKKPKTLFQEANIENAFGFDDFDISEVSPIVKSASSSRIATEKDVKQSVKGKLFPKARIKSSVLTKNSDNKIKKTMLKNVLKKNLQNKAPENIKENKDKEVKLDNINKAEENNNETETTNKALLEAVSFSDTFDVLSENGDDPETKIPDNIPLFVDLEPVHFTQPPRRSYNKRKRDVCFNVNRNDCDVSEDETEKPKPKKKKESKLSKEELKRMQEWVKSVNQSFNEIDDFDLVVE